MEKKQIEKMLWQAMSIDYNCSPEDLSQPNKLVTPAKFIEGRRMYQEKPSAFTLFSNGRSLVINCDERFTEFAENFIKDEYPEWVSGFNRLAKIEAELNKEGLTIADMHEFYLPLADFPKASVPDDVEITWYDRQEILQFKGQDIADEAYAFNERYPDMIGVSASIGGRIAAMAGASRDWEKCWQIGINVKKEAEGKGLGALLTTLLKDKLLDMGIVPFYGTAVSHMASQNVARKSGFYPAWMELYSGEKK